MNESLFHKRTETSFQLKNISIYCQFIGANVNFSSKFPFRFYASLKLLESHQTMIKSMI